MFYIHFWTKDGELTRVPYSTMEEAEEEAWRWERAESGRMNPTKKIGGFPGVSRDKMITIITDEDNQPAPIDYFGRCFFWDIKHNRYFTNENHWAVQFEAAARGLTPENVVCSADCYNCRNNVDMDGNTIKKILAAPTFSSRDGDIVRLFSNGMKRKEIAALSNLSYARVCQIIREASISV